MKTMFRNKVKTLRLVNEVIKLKVFNDLLSFVDLTNFYKMTLLEITYACVKCKPLQKENFMSKAYSLYTHETMRCSWPKRTQPQES